MAICENNPKFLYESTIFFGSKGSGKSSIINVAALVAYETQQERLSHYINYINDNPIIFNQRLKTVPNIRVNYDLTLNYYGGGGVKVEKYEPFKFMMPNNDFEFDYIHTGAIYVCDEAQRYYDSYRYKEIPAHVYRVFELSRKIKTLIHLATHRYMRIASAIRELYTSFVYVVKTEILKKDDYGSPNHIRLYYLEFNNVNDADNFYTNNKLSNDDLLASKKTKYYDFNGTIFECFDTNEFKDEFLNVSEDVKFSWYIKIKDKNKNEK